MFTDFARALDAQRPYLLPLARRLTSQDADAHILIQDTLTRAYVYRATYREDINLLGWLKTVMRNHFYSEYRRDSNRRRILREMVPPASPAYSYNDGDYTLLAEQAARVVAEQPVGFQRAFQLRVAGYAYGEIAEQLDIPIGTVKSRVFAVRTKLRTLF